MITADITLHCRRIFWRTKFMLVYSQSLILSLRKTEDSINSNHCFERIAPTPRLLLLRIRRKRLRCRLCGYCQSYKTLCSVLESQRTFSSKCGMFHGINYKESLYFIKAHRNSGEEQHCQVGVVSMGSIAILTTSYFIVFQQSSVQLLDRAYLLLGVCLVFYSHCYELKLFGSCVCLAFLGDQKQAEFTTPMPRLFKRWIALCTGYLFIYLGSAILGRDIAIASYCRPVTAPPSPASLEIDHHTWDYVPYSLQTVCGFFNISQNLYVQRL